MNSFSQRKNLKPVRTVIQADSMDEALRNNLWDALCLFYCDRVHPVPGSTWLSYHDDMRTLFYALWHRYFEQPLDTLSSSWRQTRDDSRNWFFAAAWNEVYDFIEFVAGN